MTSPLLLVLFCVFVVYADEEHGENVPSYGDNTFTEQISQSAHFIMFYAPWCGHCKRLAPTWDELAQKYNSGEEKVTIAKVDCTVETPLCSAHEVTGYPTLKFFQQEAETGVKFKGKREMENLESFIREQLQLEEESNNPQPPQPKKSLMELTADNFDSTIKFGHHFIKFYAPWCGHCQRLAPTWEQLAETFQHEETVSISKVDCTQHKLVCDQHEVRGYPTLLFFTNGQAVDRYKGSRGLTELKEYVSTMMAKENANAQRTDEQIPVRQEEPQSHVVTLTRENFEEVASSGLTFVKFYAPWCGHCKRLAPTWDELASKVNVKTNIKIAKVNCDDDKEFCREHSVQGYPTLILFINGKMVKEYDGSRSFEDLHEFVMDNLPHDEL